MRGGGGQKETRGWGGGGGGGVDRQGEGNISRGETGARLTETETKA